MNLLDAEQRPVDGKPGAATSSRRRERVALIFATVAALISTGGLVASFWVKSPEQVRAEAEAPTPTVLTATVERRVLASTVITRGTVTATTKHEVTPALGVAGSGKQIITGVHSKVGGTVQNGQVLVAISGRPLIALQGKIPTYRDLKPGDSGDDVRQLQRSLRSLGHYGGGDAAGLFGPRTKAAVAALYRRIGYEAANTGGPDGIDDRPKINAAEEAEESAQRDVTSIRNMMKAKDKPAAGEEPLAEQLARAKSRLARAQEDLAYIVARSGTMLPASEFVFLRSFPARVVAISGKVGDAVKEPLVTLTTGNLAVSVKLRPDEAESIRAGMDVEIDAETLGEQAKARVTYVGELTPDTENGGAYHPAVVTPVEMLPAQWAGLDVRISISAAQTDGEVLVVPLSAISAGADGSTTVSVRDAAGVTTRVAVRAGASGDGFVEVEPTGGRLEAGDQVVVSASA
jgi:HlyD family secretion protein